MRLSVLVLLVFGLVLASCLSIPSGCAAATLVKHTHRQKSVKVRFAAPFATRTVTRQRCVGGVCRR